MTSSARPLDDTAIQTVARRLLPRLAMRGTWLQLLPHTENDQATPRKGRTTTTCQQYGLFSPRNKYASPLLKVETEKVTALLSRDWVRQADDKVVLSPAGAAWLRRQQAGADAFRAQHQMQTTVQRKIAGVKRPVTINEGESPLGWLRRRKDRTGAPLISEFQFQAGERLRADFWRAQMTPRVTQSWSMTASSRRSRRAAPGSSVELADAVIAAKRRVQQALEAVGPELAGVLIDVCCHLKGLEEAEKAAGWPQRSGKVVLQLALSRLARHYGYVSEPELARPLLRRMQHWGSDDYRPVIDAWTEQP